MAARRSFGFAQDDRLGCCCDDITAAVKAKKSAVISAAVEGSQPVGRRLSGFVQDSGKNPLIFLLGVISNSTEIHKNFGGVNYFIK